METIKTPVGYVPRNLYKEIKNVAGFDVDKDDQDILYSQQHKAKMINPSPERKSGDKHMIEVIQWLPIRYYNYMIALGLWNGDHVKALSFCKDRFMHSDGTEKFLPKLLNDKHFAEMEYISYTKLMTLTTGAMCDKGKRDDLWNVWRGEVSPRMIGKKKLDKQKSLNI